jgi:hypothetical protein
MNRSTGPTYTRYRCKISDSCEAFDSYLGISECFERGGQLVRKCVDSSSVESHERSHPIDHSG